MKSTEAKPLVLVVDDEEANRLTLERILVRENMAVCHAANGAEGLQRIKEDRPAVVLTDLKMPGMDGLQLLAEARRIQPDLEIIMMTAFGTVETAVEAMKEGAYDFITKPLRRSDIVRVVGKALEKRALVVENRALREQLEQKRSLIGHSPAMRAVVDEARQVADSVANVLITGESGTGKGMLAEWMHAHSPRSEGALVTVNLGALPEPLMESELFGYEAGAFTGAKGRKQGRFDLADGGTLFLDEVTEMPGPVQAKLLRVLQDGSYERLGGTQTHTSDARILAATNVDPRAAVENGQLREDLFYRLDVIRLHLPPLRERIEDIPLLCRHFVQRFAIRHRRGISGLSADALGCLQSWRWPGNVRELENAIERAVVLCRSELIEPADLPTEIARVKRAPDQLTFSVGTPLKNVERRMIEATLKKCDGDKIQAADQLGITTRTIYRREAEWRQRE